MSLDGNGLHLGGGRASCSNVDEGRSMWVHSRMVGRQFWQVLQGGEKQVRRKG